jgi:hypothetical protein
MTVFQGFLLRLIVAWTPSVIFLACIAAQAGAQRYGHTANAHQTIAGTAAVRTS